MGLVVVDVGLGDDPVRVVVEAGLSFGVKPLGRCDAVRFSGRVESATGEFGQGASSLVEGDRGAGCPHGSGLDSDGQGLDRGFLESGALVVGGGLLAQLLGLVVVAEFGGASGRGLGRTAS